MENDSVLVTDVEPAHVETSIPEVVHVSHTCTEYSA
jgi:hypothetical protein